MNPRRAFDVDKKIRFTVFLKSSLAEKLQGMPRKTRNEFINEKLESAVEREQLFSHMESMKHTKTSFKRGQAFIKKIRKEWQK